MNEKFKYAEDAANMKRTSTCLYDFGGLFMLHSCAVIHENKPVVGHFYFAWADRGGSAGAPRQFHQN